MTIWQVLLVCFLAGFAMPVGACFAYSERIRPRWLEKDFRHSVIAFGGGALLSAVALVLVPDGIEYLDNGTAILSLLLGAVAMVCLEVYLNRRKSEVGQLVAMLTDFVPESLALGSAFASGSTSAGVLAAMIALQNLPEGFNAYRELSHGTRMSTSVILSSFFAMSFLGPVAGGIGYFFLSSRSEVVGMVELSAAGAILYLVFQDIAPKASIARHWAPSFGAVLGFALGLIGHLLAH